MRHLVIDPYLVFTDLESYTIKEKSKETLNVILEYCLRHKISLSFDLYPAKTLPNEKYFLVCDTYTEHYCDFMESNRMYPVATKYLNHTCIPEIMRYFQFIIETENTNN